MRYGEGGNGLNIKVIHSFFPTVTWNHYLSKRLNEYVRMGRILCVVHILFFFGSVSFNGDYVHFILHQTKSDP